MERSGMMMVRPKMSTSTMRKIGKRGERFDTARPYHAQAAPLVQPSHRHFCRHSASRTERASTAGRVASRMLTSRRSASQRYPRGIAASIVITRDRGELRVTRARPWHRSRRVARARSCEARSRARTRPLACAVAKMNAKMYAKMNNRERSVAIVIDRGRQKM